MSDCETFLWYHTIVVVGSRYKNSREVWNVRNVLHGAHFEQVVQVFLIVGRPVFGDPGMPDGPPMKSKNIFRK